MKFERGKSAQDPIYLRKPSGEYWMEGDVYECLCGCLTQIFGPRNFFIDSFTPKFGLSDEKFYTVAVTDKDGDTHGFVAKVVNAEEFDRTQRGGGFRQEIKEIRPAIEDAVDEIRNPVEDDTIKVQSETATEDIGAASDPHFFDTIVNPNEALDIDEEELKMIKEQLKREKEIEELNIEMEKDTGNPPANSNKPKTRGGRGQTRRGRGRKQK